MITSLTHRTHRVHWIQRVMMVLMRGPMFLSSTALLLSKKRLRSLPNCMDWSCSQHTMAKTCYFYKSKSPKTSLPVPSTCWIIIITILFKRRFRSSRKQWWHIFLPEGHILPPGHRLGSLKGDWPTGTPSHPLYQKRVKKRNAIVLVMITK